MTTTREGDWLHQLAIGRAQTVVAVPGGVATLHGDFPAAHDHNKLSIISATAGNDVADAAEKVLGSAGCRHRLIEVRCENVPDTFTQELIDRRYSHEIALIMTYNGPGGRPQKSADVHTLTMTERIRAAESDWRADLPDEKPEVWWQLGDRIRTVLPIAEVAFLGVRDNTGRVLAHADVYLRSGVAQVEEVYTVAEARGRGFASLLVASAVRWAQAKEAELIFLVADADDWPKELYERLGFETSSTFATFRRSPITPA